MSEPQMDFGAISQILGSLSAEDMENLKNAAQSMFSSGQNGETPRQNQSPPKKEQPKNDGFDFSSFAQLASIMSALNSEKNDPRCDLLSALRPLVGKERQQKIDQAIKMLRLISVVKVLGVSGG